MTFNTFIIIIIGNNEETTRLYIVFLPFYSNFRYRMYFTVLFKF